MAASPSDDSGLARTPPWANQRAHSFATLASPGTSPDGARTVWGTAAVASSTPPLQSSRPQPIDDGWLQDWERDLLDEPDAVALVEASLSGESSSKAVPMPASNKKNKKKKMITLMSTTVRRGA